MVRYAELHCHTNMSFLDGASHPAELVAVAAALGYTALGVTDHDGFRGAAKVHQAAREFGMPVVYGTEIGMPRGVLPEDESSLSFEPSEAKAVRASNSPTHRRGRIRRMHGSKPTNKPDTDHVVLLAPNPEGYAAIAHLVTKGQYRGKKDQPLYSYRDLEEASRHGNLVALSGCRNGAVNRAALHGDLNKALGEAERLKDLFPGRFYLEVWDHGMPEDDLRNDVIAEVSRITRVPMVATNNVHYALRSDADLAEVLAAIGGRRDLDTADGFRPATDERYLRSPEEMQRQLGRYRGAVEMAAELGESLAFDLDLVAPALPDFPMPGAFTTEIEYLSHLAFEGAREVYPGEDGRIDPRAKARLRVAALAGPLPRPRAVDLEPRPRRSGAHRLAPPAARPARDAASPPQTVRRLKRQ